MTTKVDIPNLHCKYCGRNHGYEVYRHGLKECGLCNSVRIDEPHYHFYCRCGWDYKLEIPNKPFKDYDL